MDGINTKFFLEAFRKNSQKFNYRQQLYVLTNWISFLKNKEEESEIIRELLIEKTKIVKIIRKQNMGTRGNFYRYKLYFRIYIRKLRNMVFNLCY